MSGLCWSLLPRLIRNFLICADVIYNNNMKAFGLYQLVLLFIKWENENKSSDDNENKVND